MCELFSDIFTYRRNALTTMDPRVKLGVALAALFCVLLSARPFYPLLLFAACVSGLLVLRMPPRLVLARLAAPVGMALVLIAVQSLLVGNTPLTALAFGGWRITLFREGFHSGELLGARVLGAVSIMLLLSAVTPVYQILHALRWCGVPAAWTEIALLMYRYIFALVEGAEDTADAQRLRLGYCGVRRSLASFGVLAGSVVVRSMDQAMRTHDAMMLRGYRGVMPCRPLPSLRTRDVLTCSAAFLLLGLVCLFLNGKLR